MVRASTTRTSSHSRKYGAACDNPEDHDLYLCPRWLDLQALAGRSAQSHIESPGFRIPFYTGSPTTNARYRRETLFRDLDPWPPPPCFAGSLSGHRTELTDGTSSDRSVEAILAEAETRARNLSLPLVAPYLTSTSIPPAGKLDGQAVFAEFEAWLRPQGRSITDYVGDLPSKRRISVRHELRQFTKRGLTSDVETLEKICAPVAQLVAENSAKYGIVSDHGQLSEYLRLLSSIFSHDCVAFTARRGRDLLGVSVGIRHGDRLYIRMVGFDADETAGSFAYFVTTFYAPLDAAQTLRVNAIHLGVGGLEAKLRRGATAEPLHHWIFDPTKTLLPRALSAASLRRRADQLAKLGALGLEIEPIG